MGVYKLCAHKGRMRDRCAHAWWAAFQFKGELHRVSLERWTSESVRSKAQARAAFDRLKDAVRSGHGPSAKTDRTPTDLTFAAFVDIYAERYVRANGLASADTIEYRLAPLKRTLGARPLAEIRAADIEDFIAVMKQPAKLRAGDGAPRVRTPATINRFLSLLTHMLNWAVARR